MEQEMSRKVLERARKVAMDALARGDHVVIVDDLLATGGTAKAAAKLVELLGAYVKAFAFLVELGFLDGRERLRDFEVISLVNYPTAE
jgi:adenine phosphoribosyltransferase